MKGELELYKSLFRIGLVGFGGGSALIPVMEDELVNEKGILSKKEYDKTVVVASLTPGALPIGIATGVGMKYGYRGMLLAPLCLALPGVILILAFLMTMASLQGAFYKKIECITMGVTFFIMILLIEYILNELKKAKKEGSLRVIKVIGIILSVYIMVGQKNIIELFHLPYQPLFQMSTVLVMGITCFFVIWTKGRYGIKNVSIPLAIIFLYLLMEAVEFGNVGNTVQNLLCYLMILLTIGSCVVELVRQSTKKDFPWKKCSYEVISWCTITGMILLFVFIINNEFFVFLVKGLFSSFISFGGGDAYLSLADSLFVESKMISSVDFYEKVVPIANLLPGSILCKILTGVGYYIGGNMLKGIIVAIGGALMGVCGTGIIFAIVYEIYMYFHQIDMFTSLGRWVRPVVAGLLIKVLYSLGSRAVSVGNQNQVPSWGIIALMVLLVSGSIWVRNRWKIKNLYVLLICIFTNIVMYQI